MARQISHQDIEALAAKLRDFSKGLSDKERLVVETMVTSELRRSRVADGKLSDEDLEHVAGGQRPQQERTYVISGHPAWCCG